MGRMGSAPAWVWGVGLLVIAVAAWRLVSCARDGETIDVGVVCTSCKFEGVIPVRKGTDPWPVKCPKCGKRTAFAAYQCPRCMKLIPWDPKKPPTTCPYCEADLSRKE